MNAPRTRRLYSMRVSYIGNEQEDTDYECAKTHGTVYVREFASGPIPLDANRHFTLAVMYWDQGLVKFREDTMTLLIPDRDRENREDFIWCLPIERQKWNKWYALSEQFKTVTPEIHGGIRYMNRMEGKEVKTILMMPTADQSDDDAVTACAYLRMIKGLSCRMYVVRCTDQQLKGSSLINAVMGTPPELLTEVDDDS